MASRKSASRPDCISLTGLNNPVYGYGRMYVALRQEVSSLAEIANNASVAVSMTTPNLVKGYYEGQKRVVFTMWETDTLSEEMFVAHLHRFDQVLVPCRHNQKLFGQHHDNVAVVPLGVDTDFYGLRKSVPQNKTFRFMAGGSHWMRKGLDVVVRAFSELNLPGTELVLKCTPETIGGIPKITHDRIIIHESFMPADKDRDLYYTSDCYIAMSRGEGWGLMPLQAMCMGIPTIVSNTSGHQEFLELATLTVDTTPQPVNCPPYYLSGNWDEPDIDGLKDSMAWMMDNRQIATDTALANAKKASRFTWTNSAKELIKATGLGVKLDKPKWIEGPNNLVPIRVRRRVQAEIGSHKVDLQPGIEHLVPANVKKVIADAGYLAQ